MKQNRKEKKGKKSDLKQQTHKETQPSQQQKLEK